MAARLHNYFTRMGLLDPSPQAFKQRRGTYIGQYVKQTEEVAADSPGGRHDGGKEEEVALVVVVLVIVELRFDSGIERYFDIFVLFVLLAHRFVSLVTFFVSRNSAVRLYSKIT
jgi:hypothetical protein